MSAVAVAETPTRTLAAIQAKSTFIRLIIFQAPSDCPRGRHLYPIASEYRSGGMSALLQPFSLVECLLMAEVSRMIFPEAADRCRTKGPLCNDGSIEWNALRTRQLSP